MHVVGPRRLTLRGESLAALTSDELAGVVGGSHACEVTHGESIDQSCQTVPVTVCWDRLYDVLFTSACG